jgi:hypothetical protein
MVGEGISDLSSLLGSSGLIEAQKKMYEWYGTN